MIRTFITNCVPPTDIIRLMASQAANNFCFNLVENNCFDKAFSILPISYRINNIDDKTFIYYSNKGNGTLSKLLSQLKNSIDLANRTKDSDVIWFYNISKTSMLVYILLRYIYRKKVLVILADHTPGNKKISYQNFLEWLIRRSFGILSLSSRTTIRHENFAVLPGIIPKSQINYTKKVFNQSLKFLFSGTLSPVTGFEMALKVFSKISNAELYISGNGNFPKEYMRFNNIHFMGLMDYEEYKKMYDKVDICLNFRNPYLLENQNNFPSKVLEYFSNNKVVISTVDYPEIKGAKYIVCKYDEDALIEVINKLLSQSFKNLEQYTDNTDFIKDNLSEDVWKKTFNLLENDVRRAKKNRVD